MEILIFIGFLGGGGTITPNFNTFEMGGFIGYSLVETDNKSITPLSSLSINGKFGYSFVDEFFVYGLIGIKNLAPVDPIPNLNNFGIGTKLTFLSKQRTVNISIDSHIEIMPFLASVSRSKFPNAIFWQIVPTMSFRVAHSIAYVGGGYKDFLLRFKNGEELRSRPNSRFLIVVGGDYHLNPDTFITLEMQSFGQSAIFGGISHRF